MYPLKFIPVYKDYMWGGRSFERFGRVLPEGSIAESWEVSCHPGGLSIISNGDLRGISLYDVMQKYGNSLLGYGLPEFCIGRFPLLIKFIDAKDRLSVQVHPDDAYAKEHENEESGKNECWYIISAKPSAKIICGVVPGMTRDAFMEAVQNNAIDKCLNQIEVSQGDVINIPSGVVHSIGEGIVLTEIQQSSNSTYRIYDYDRIDKNGLRRELHLDKAVEVIDFKSAGIGKKTAGLVVELGTGTKKSYRIANRCFSLEKYDINGTVTEEADGGKFAVYIAIDGEGEINYRNGSEKIKAGESLLVPADMGRYEFSGELSVLKTYVPDLERDVIKPLKDAGYKEEQIYENISGLK